MKATYIKPELFYENYELSQHMAACGWDLQHASKETCSAFFDPGLNNSGDGSISIFISGPQCSIVVSGGDQGSGTGGEYQYCYTNGEFDMIRVFQS